MTQIYHPYTAWEDWQAGMWKPSLDPSSDAEHAAAILGEPSVFAGAAQAMLADWPTSAEQNLTDMGQNRRSWIGQATCCHLAGISEAATRQAWWTLSNEERDDANAVADEAILEWELARANEGSLFSWPLPATPAEGMPDCA